MKFTQREKKKSGWFLHLKTNSFLKGHKSISRNGSFSQLHNTNNSRRGRQAKEHDRDDMSLLSTWRKKNSSLYEVFTKESNDSCTRQLQEAQLLQVNYLRAQQVMGIHMMRCSVLQHVFTLYVISSTPSLDSNLLSTYYTQTPSLKIN